MNIARIDPNTFEVVNIEVADDEWLSRAATLETGYLFVPYTEANPAVIGGTYDPETGVFTPPPTPTPLPAQEA